MRKTPPLEPGSADGMQSPDALAREHLSRKLSLLGPVAWLYSRLPEYQHLFLQDLEWAVLPALMCDQYCLFRRENLPYAFFTWAYVSDEVHQRLLSGQRKLAPKEWKSGKKLWVIDAVAPLPELESLLTEVQQLSFRGQRLHYFSLDPATGKTVIREWIGSPKIHGMHAAPPQKH